MCIGGIFYMKKFMVTVNGNKYEVEVDEVIDNIKSTVESNARKNDETSTPVKNNNANTISAEQTSIGITTQMPGTIIKLNVSVGDTVEKGQVLMVLEAMKMENEIYSPSAGKVVSINVSEGTTVNTRDILMNIE